MYDALAEANHCRTKADCRDVGDYCPFGCDIYVNKDEVQQIRRLLDSYDSDCEYKCPGGDTMPECVEDECVSGS